MSARILLVSTTGVWIQQVVFCCLPEVQPGGESSQVALVQARTLLRPLRDEAGKLRAQGLESDWPGFDPSLAPSYLCDAG